MNSNSLLIVDDNKRIRETLKRNFCAEGFEVNVADSIREAMDITRRTFIDLIILDIRLGEESGIDALRVMQRLIPGVPVIMITGYATVETAVQSIKIGAVEYIKKPIKFSDLLLLVNKWIRREEKEGIVKYSRFITRHHRMQTILNKALKLAGSDLSVLILGESGTGKEVLADFIHENSLRKDKEILKINCAAFPETLLDNELFGHERGAFTGADDKFLGVFERANRGTLFLDEIADMRLSIQAKILRALQNQEIRRIGGDRNVKIDIRYIAATNRDINALMEEKSFRTDLYYRLNAAKINIPSLKERLEDISLLAEHFLHDQAVKNGRSNLAISKEALSVMETYSWPGNVRELKAAVAYAATVCNGRLINPGDLPFGDEISKSCNGSRSNAASDTSIEAMERQLLIRTLSKTLYNKTKTAEILRISRSTLYSKLEKYGISVPS